MIKFQLKLDKKGDVENWWIKFTVNKTGGRERSFVRAYVRDKDKNVP